MASEICQALRNKEKENELKKHSIYLLGDDENDRGFEFFLFIDPEDDIKRPSFLKELHNVVIKGEDCKEFVELDNKKKLKEWLGINSNIDPTLTPLNWLKIAIERYPYRLFVVIDEKNWSKDDKNPLNNVLLHTFLKKRICWISKEEFKKHVDNPNDDAKAKCQSFKIWLFTKWIKHIVYSIRELKSKEILHFYFIKKEDEESFYSPTTLPGCFNPSEPGQKKNGEEFDVEISIESISIAKAIHDRSPVYKKVYLCYSRHGDFYGFDKNKFETELPSFSSNLYYSENLSGALSYFSQLYNSRTDIKNKDDYKSKIFFLKLSEQALMRIGICDERFQEWWINLPLKRVGSLQQSRINPIYLDDENKYGQKDFPSHGFYSIIKKSGKENPFEIYSFPEKDSEITSASILWPEDQKGIDMLIIHQGILDKWKKDHRVKEILTREILYLKEKVPFIIVTSGRGKPENLPEGIKYLGFSGLEACMVGTYFEKLTLLRQAMILI